MAHGPAGGGGGPDGMGPGFPPSGPPGMRNFLPHVPFDFVLCDPQFFQPCQEAPDDKATNELLLKRNTDLSPSAEEQQAVTGLLSKVQAVFDALIISPDSLEAAQMAEVRPVGSYKKGTMLSGHNVADLVVIFKTLPTKEAVRSVANRVLEEAKTDAKFVTVSQQPYGFQVSSADAVVKVLVATLPANLKLLEPDLHLDARIQQTSLAAIRHARWFEENGQHSSVKVLIRLLKDLRQRFPGLTAMSPWIIDLLAHYAVMQNPARAPLPLARAFRRVLELLSTGLFLPGSVGIADPCEPGQVRVHTALTLVQQDEVCCTAQTLLRVLSHGGLRHVLGLEGSARIATEMSVWRGIVVTPSDKVYERQDEDTAAAATTSAGATGEGQGA
uniref:DZF domain-containing protein n=3 Tax=Macrostomum lignano TaxID=282301 RepID=A0A1I8JIE7_9PLAT